MGSTPPVYRAGKPVKLSPSTYLASGGEGAVYRVGPEVYKVYLDPEKARRAGMDTKLAELARIRHPGIAAPVDALQDKTGQLVGLVLPFVPGDPLCTLFTNTWQQAHQFDAVQRIQVVDAMREVTHLAHQHGACMVDANEMNWLVQGSRPVAIDVDSWQLPGFPATAIMPSIRDHAHRGFSEATDWFAWAVVTFQLWTGIHPYKGTHPDFKRGALEDRMRAMASVFDPRVRLPAAARPLQDIPKPLRDWYAQTFSSALRTAPPPANASIEAKQPVPKLKLVQTVQGAMRIERLGIAGDAVLGAVDGLVLARRGAQLFLWDALAKADVPRLAHQDLAALADQTAMVYRAPFGRVLLKAEGSRLIARDLESGTEGTVAIRTFRLWQARRRVFAVMEGSAQGLVELDALRIGDGLVLSTRARWPVNAQATTFFQGGFAQDGLGTVMLGMVLQEGLLLGTAPTLKGHRIVDGFALDAHNMWLSVIRAHDGQSLRLRLAYAASKFEIVDTTVTDTLELDATSTLAGVGLLHDQDELLVLKGEAMRRTDGSALPKNLRLFSLGVGIGGHLNGEVARLSLGV